VVVVHTPLTRVVSRAVAPEDNDSDDSERLARAFHYAIPQPLRDVARPGQLVWVPFGARYLQGVIVNLAEQSPVEQTRELDEIVDTTPVLSPVQLELARWISSYYLAPLHLAIEAMLPPGVTQTVQTVLEAVADVDLSAASEDERSLYELVRAQGPLDDTAVRPLLRRRGMRAQIERLVARGWLAKRHQVQPPAVRPKQIAVVRAAADAQPTALPERAAQQRIALRALCARRERGEGWLPLREAAAEAGVAPATLRALVDRGLVELELREIWRDPLAGRAFVPVDPPTLTPDQADVWAAIEADLMAPRGRPFLLQGVTGSGKTEIYLRAVRRVLERGRSAIVLVPEIALTPQTIRRFGARFPEVLAVLHSRLSAGERYDQWRRIRAGELRLVVGSRSALFAPMRDLGLIVVDEEHESSYKQEQTPRYHARDAAVRLAQLCGGTCILGSATPALESAYRAERGEYTLLTMPQRIMGHRKVVDEQAAGLVGGGSAGGRFHRLAPELDEALYAELPPVEVVDMRSELHAGNRGIFSRSLHAALQETLAQRQQAILFLNRRGSSTFVNCRDCGFVLKCPRCDLPLTYHESSSQLTCHHCSHTAALSGRCPNCKSTRIRHFGIGTERVEEQVHAAFPQARVVRWDLDTTGGRLAHERLLDAFVGGRADIMIGTQMIAKGLDLPRVTLVGVISADTMLNLPDLRASERTFQLLTQVAGRAGRSVLGGKVIIQTYTPQHPAIQAASRHDYAAFYAQELDYRREHWYPPLSRFVCMLYVHENARQAQAEAERMAGVLRFKIARLGLPELDVIGPAPAFFARLRGKWRWQIILRGTDPTVLLRDMDLALGWRVDVDPVAML
jgi:primosomal protein N' (replication factor Y)